MGLRPTQGVKQKFTFTYDHADGTVTEELSYYPGQIDAEAPTYTEPNGDGEPQRREEELGEWFDRVAPGTYVDEDGQPIAATEFLQRYPHNLFLMREAQLAILRDHNPFLRARKH
jgi:hypothetical protein